MNKIQTLSLPISSVTAVATLLLPILNGGGIGGAQYLVTGSGTSNRERKAPQSWLIIFTLLFLVIYEAVIATLTFVHIAPPSDLVCGLERTWGRLYSNKDEWAIKRIQEVHQCCGLHTVKDKAWPFADKKLDRGNDACLKAFGRQKACLGEWRRDEQISAGLLFMVALTLILLKVRRFDFVIPASSLLRYHPPWKSMIVSKLSSTATYPCLFPNGQAMDIPCDRIPTFYGNRQQR